LLGLTAREIQFLCRTRPLGPQEENEVRIPPQGNVSQAKIQTGENALQEIHPVLGFEHSGVPLAQQQTLQLHLSPILAITTPEGTLDLAVGLILYVLKGDSPS
jgi:hypothetical protein